MSRTPCYNCTDRTAECHSTCEKYIEWSKDLRIKKQQAWESRIDVTQYSISKCVKNKEYGIKKRGK